MTHHQFPKISGTTTVGERGQVVIPSSIRKSMKIKTGDKFVVFCKHGEFIGLLRSDRFDSFLDKMTGHISNRLKEIDKLKNEINKQKS